MIAVLDAIAVVLLCLGVTITLIAGIGVLRFPDVLSRMHAASKPQMFGLVLLLTAIALHVRSWSITGMLLVVLLAQLFSIPVASAMTGRAAFRRGFNNPAFLAIDELTPRLAEEADPDEDADGFKDAPGDRGALPANVVDEDAHPAPVNNRIAFEIEADDEGVIVAKWDEEEVDENQALAAAPKQAGAAMPDTGAGPGTGLDAPLHDHETADPLDEEGEGADLPQPDYSPDDDGQRDASDEHPEVPGPLDVEPVDEPVTDEPVADEPVTHERVTDEPATDEPVDAAPIDSAPRTDDDPDRR